MPSWVGLNNGLWALCMWMELGEGERVNNGKGVEKQRWCIGIPECQDGEGFAQGSFTDCPSSSQLIYSAYPEDAFFPLGEKYLTLECSAWE